MLRPSVQMHRKLYYKQEKQNKLLLYQPNNVFILDNKSDSNAVLLVTSIDQCIIFIIHRSGVKLFFDLYNLVLRWPCVVDRT